eukprot:6214847-Pleurochrysis_carterae.AAC.1
MAHVALPSTTFSILSAMRAAHAWSLCVSSTARSASSKVCGSSCCWFCWARSSPTSGFGSLSSVSTLKMWRRAPETLDTCTSLMPTIPPRVLRLKVTTCARIPAGILSTASSVMRFERKLGMRST